MRVAKGDALNHVDAKKSVLNLMVHFFLILRLSGTEIEHKY